jgi:hypothetical protein
MEEVLSTLKEYVLPHWPFLTFAFVVMVVAQMLKKRLLTKVLAKKSRFIFWVRRVFPLALISLGVVTGLVWPGAASPGVTATAHKVLYFSGASAAAIAGFNVIKQWAKRKHDIDLSFGELDQ